jgi:hypothetical protein
VSDIEAENCQRKDRRAALKRLRRSPLHGSLLSDRRTAQRDGERTVGGDGSEYRKNAPPKRGLEWKPLPFEIFLHLPSVLLRADNQDRRPVPVGAFAENQTSITLVPFPPRFEIDAAFHADASLLAVEHAL